jgi:hypothetical protein
MAAAASGALTVDHVEGRPDTLAAPTQPLRRMQNLRAPGGSHYRVSVMVVPLLSPPGS